MKNLTKTILLFSALLLPALIFLFLRQFGQNEFAVAPLYATEQPPVVEGCPRVVDVPYRIREDLQQKYRIKADSLTVIFFGALNGEAANQYARVSDEIANEPVQVMTGIADSTELFSRRCEFFLTDPADVVMIDHKGAIRGHYTAGDLGEMDRLLTEVAIILRKF